MNRKSLIKKAVKKEKRCCNKHSDLCGVAGVNNRTYYCCNKCPMNKHNKKEKKQHTVWHWTSLMSKGNFAQVGIIHNYKGKVKEDIIRVRFISSKPNFGWEVSMRVDEALTLIAGLSKTLTRMIYLDKKHTDLFKMSAKLK